MASLSSSPVGEPFPIFRLAHRFLLYDAEIVAHVRSEYNICGVLIGSLPQAPQQNVFLGLPLELMPEEARLLVEKNVAYIVDDTKNHKNGFLRDDGLGREEREAYRAALRRQGVGAAKEVIRRTDEKKKDALKRHFGTDNWNDIPEDMLKSGGDGAGRRKASAKHRRRPGESSTNAETRKGEALFDAALDDAVSTQDMKQDKSNGTDPEPYAITPAVSSPPLKADPAFSNDAALVKTPTSYPLFKHLHSKGYFMSPGIRFGCQYVAYPGDPLRFHSHFLSNGLEWDQDFDLLDLVGGGRLGTGVKKGFLIGGESDPKDKRSEDGVRAFCVEWGGM